MKRTRLIRFLFGGGLVLLGILLNEWIIAWLLIPDGRIDALGLRVLLWAASLLCIASGSFLAWYRPDASAPRSRWSLWVSGIATVFAVGLAEMMVSLMGFQPWVPVTLGPHAEEVSGQSMFAPDTVAGYALRPGDFTVRLPSGYTFSARHQAGGLRATQVAKSDSLSSTDESLWLFGNSYTYGWALDDEDTFAWLLQHRLARYRVVNLGVPGYSTVQALHRFRQALAHRPKPALVIVVYASFHDARNVLARTHRKRISYSMETEDRNIPTLPRAQLSAKNSLVFSTEPLAYRAIPFARFSALANLLDNAINVVEQYSLDSQAVSQAVLRTFAEMARQQGITFVVAGITDDPTTKDLLDYCRKQGITALDIAIDLRRAEYTNLPHDAHPSAAANLIYADRLETFVTTLSTPRQQKP